MSLLNRAEHVFSSESILDLDTEHQTHWQVTSLHFLCYTVCQNNATHALEYPKQLEVYCNET